MRGGSNFISAETADFIPDGAWNYHITINLRDDAEMPKLTKPVRGGSREGSGRPGVKTKIKRIQLIGDIITG